MFITKSGSTQVIAALIILVVVMSFSITTSYAQDDVDEISKAQTESNQSHNNSKSDQDHFQKWALFPIITSSAEKSAMV